MQPLVPNNIRSIGSLAERMSNESRWLPKNTAMLIVHGIGNQVPLATLDSFARGIAETLQAITGKTLVLEHRFEKVSDGSIWFNNYIRIKVNEASEDVPHLDLYEYYWAHHAHNRATMSSIRLWIRDTVKQAKQFYKEYGAALREASPSSRFLRSDGDLHWWRYSFFLFLVGQAVPAMMWLFGLLPKMAKAIPFVGAPISSWLDQRLKRSSYQFANVIGDVVIYNTADAKSEHYRIRQDILKEAVQSLRRLVEPRTEGEPGPYGRVIVAGHSLGSQISFDAINRLNHLITQGELRGIRREGTYQDPSSTPITDVLCGFVTFGSPLDKIAFFLTEQCERDEYLRIQMLRNYHCFKQRIFELDPQPKFELKPAIPRLFDNIEWINYHDKRDYVSGRLDFYEKLVNVDCNLGGNLFSFTHGWYWKDQRMFADIIEHFILTNGTPHHQVHERQPFAQPDVRSWRWLFRPRKVKR